MDYEIERKELADRYVATVRLQITPDRIGSTFQEVLPEVDAEILGAGTRPTGPPFAIFHAYHEDRVDMEAGFPTDEPIPTSGRVIGRELAASAAAVTFHHGSYDGLSEAHRAVEAWLAEHRVESSGPPWEVYWTGPMDSEDRAAWRTEVGYPFREE